MDIPLQFDKFLTLKAKKCIFIYENWLIVTIIYHNSQVGNRSRLFVSGRRGDGIWFRKTTKNLIIGGVAINGGSGCNMFSVRNMYCPSTTY